MDPTISFRRTPTAHGLDAVASELQALAEISERLGQASFPGGPPPPVADERAMVVPATGERCFYMSPDGPLEVRAGGYRYTPNGVTCAIGSERADLRITVAARLLRPIHGLTRLARFDTFTGELRDIEKEAGAPAGGEGRG